MIEIEGNEAVVVLALAGTVESCIVRVNAFLSP
jgi:hypothetical protein